MKRKGLRRLLAKLLVLHPEVEFCHTYNDYYDGPDVDCFLPDFDRDCSDCLVVRRMERKGWLPRDRKDLKMYITVIQEDVKNKRKEKVKCEKSVAVSVPRSSRDLLRLPGKV